MNRISLASTRTRPLAGAALNAASHRSCRAFAVTAILLAGCCKAAVAQGAAPYLYSFHQQDGGMPVAADQRYDNSRGFGFLAAVDGQPQAFSVRVAPGDYRVTVQLRSAGPRTVFPWLEDRRMLAAPVVLAAGAGHSHQFVVNVRDTRLDPVWADTAAEPRVAISADEARARDWDDQLTVGMAGITDTLASVKIEPIQA